jgi:hypothetical protein
MQALELISFSGNPYLVCSLICILALSGNVKARKIRLQRPCILALEKHGQKGKFFCRQKFALLHRSLALIDKIYKETNYLTW